MALCVVAGAGPGMGAAIARRFARERFDIALVARGAERLADLASSLETLGITAKAYGADLTKPQAIPEVFEAIRSSQGDPDVLVYNAAGWTGGPAAGIAVSDFADDLSISIVSALACVQEVFPAMRRNARGTILFTGGGIALHPEGGAGMVSLSVGKAGLRALAYALAKEMSPDGVHAATVTIAGPVAPGTLFDPSRIADRYWRLHVQKRESWKPETLFRGV